MLGRRISLLELTPGDLSSPLQAEAGTQPSTLQSESSTKTSSQTSTAQRGDVQAAQAAQAAQTRLLTEGIALPGCEPWRHYPLLDPERLLRAFDVGGTRDSLTWLDFCREATAIDSAYFESPVGFILVQRIKLGVSAEVHGGAWRQRRAVAASAIDPATHAMLNLICREWKLSVLLSSYPSRNRGAAQWDARFGFEATGLIPMADVWGGSADNLILTARFSRGASGGGDEGGAR